MSSFKYWGSSISEIILSVPSRYLFNIFFSKLSVVNINSLYFSVKNWMLLYHFLSFSLFLNCNISKFGFISVSNELLLLIINSDTLFNFKLLSELNFIFKSKSFALLLKASSLFWFFVISFLLYKFKLLLKQLFSDIKAVFLFFCFSFLFCSFLLILKFIIIYFNFSKGIWFILFFCFLLALCICGIFLIGRYKSGNSANVLINILDVFLFSVFSGFAILLDVFGIITLNFLPFNEWDFFIYSFLFNN